MSSSQLKDVLATAYAAYPTLFVTSVLVLAASLYAMGLFSRSNHFLPAGKHCYIGGGSEGLGFSLASQLVARGAHVTIVSRSEAKLALALAALEKHRVSPTQILQALSCDLTSCVAAATTLDAACKPFDSRAPDYIFACAGGCVPTLFTDMSADQHWYCMEWNFKSALNTIHEGVVRMKKDGKGGKVVLTASVMGLFGFAGYSSYSPSKYAIRGLADSLRNELILYGIQTHLFLPATIFSPGFENEQRLKPALCKTIEGPDEGMTPDQVAGKLIAGLERNEYYITYEPVGNMLRNSRGIVPRNNVVVDTLWGIAGTVVFPFWRIFAADGEVHKERRRLQKK